MSAQLNKEAVPKRTLVLDASEPQRHGEEWSVPVETDASSVLWQERVVCPNNFPPSLESSLKHWGIDPQQITKVGEVGGEGVVFRGDRANLLHDGSSGALNKMAERAKELASHYVLPSIGRDFEYRGTGYDDPPTLTDAEKKAEDFLNVGLLGLFDRLEKAIFTPCPREASRREQAVEEALLDGLYPPDARILVPRHLAYKLTPLGEEIVPDGFPPIFVSEVIARNPRYPRALCPLLAHLNTDGLRRLYPENAFDEFLRAHREVLERIIKLQLEPDVYPGKRWAFLAREQVLRYLKKLLEGTPVELAVMSAIGPKSAAKEVAEEVGRQEMRYGWIDETAKLMLQAGVPLNY